MMWVRGRFRGLGANIFSFWDEAYISDEFLLGFAA